MVIVPRDVLEKLQKGVSEEEENSKLPFDFDDFIKSVDHESKVRDYLSRRNIEYVGTGTSRTAFLIPKGSCVDARDRSVCFKIAKNLVGVKQNQTEHRIIKKYGENSPCFVKIFKYDDRRNLCLESEIGSRLSQFDMKEYFSDWNNFMKKTDAERSFSDKFKSFFSMHGRKYRSVKKILTIENFEDDFFDILFTVKDFRKLGSHASEDNNLKKYNEEAGLYIRTIKKCAKNYPKYSGVGGLIELLFEKGAEAELRIGEFTDEDNFAMVYRDDPDPVLLPIDYGITQKVFEDFYGKNARKEYFEEPQQQSN